MFGHRLHPRPATGSALGDLSRIFRRIYRPEKAIEAMDRLHEDDADGRFRPNRNRTMARMPNPGQTAMLGELLAIDCAELDESGRLTGNLRHIKWPRGRGPAMLWSPKLDAVVAFPKAPIEPPVHELGPGDQAASDVYRTWTRGRDPFGKGSMVQPAPPMVCYGPAIATLYASDKFNDRGHVPARPYLHHHDRDVWLWVSRTDAARGILAIMVRGGDLRITEDGLAG